MRTGKIAGIALAVFLLVGGHACAQAPSDTRTPPTVDEIVQKMTSELSLTQDQAKALKPLIEQGMAKYKELREALMQQGADREAMRSQMEQLSQEQDQQLSKILTPEQMETLKSLKAQRRLNSEKRQNEMPH